MKSWTIIWLLLLSLVLVVSLYQLLYVLDTHSGPSMVSLLSVLVLGDAGPLSLLFLRFLKNRPDGNE
jgi:hypothetical protein